MDRGRLDIERVFSGLTLHRVGRLVGSRPNAEVVAGAPSTNDLAWARLGDAAADGFVVFAEHQSRGRGRLGRRWESPRGASLLLSVLLVGPEGQRGPRAGLLGPRLGLLAAVACHDAIAEATGIQTEIKWPNDILARGRKLGGILVESRTQGAQQAARTSAAGSAAAHVVGIGINCLQHQAHFEPELADRATSLDLVATWAIDRNALARALLTQLDRWYADVSAWTGDQVRRAWLERATPLGTRVRLAHAGRTYSGHVIDLDPTASLLVQLDDGQRRLFDAASTTVLHD